MKSGFEHDNIPSDNIPSDNIPSDNISSDNITSDNIPSDNIHSDSIPLDNVSLDNIPSFAIIGHPNEGKSSVVSTLTEDDTVRIGPIPGETVVCQPFPVIIDGKKIITFIDTPGFQNPRETLTWMNQYRGPDELLVQAFIDQHKSNPAFRDECELLSPVAQGAGIIYVVDGSRPVRSTDRIEMEILRITARPRMSIINCKEDETAWLGQWKTEFRKHFNAIRTFNAHKGTWAERIDLLESLKGVDQDWQPALNRVIEAFKSDWKQRNFLTAAMAVEMIEQILCFTLTGNIGDKQNQNGENEVKKVLEERFRKEVEVLEKKTYHKIRRLYRHNIFNCELPPNSILNETLFSEKTWQFLGLSPRETALASGFAGGAAGAVLDAAAAGLTFGLFSAIGVVVGTGSALLSGNRVADLKFRGVRLGKDQLCIGPLCNLQLMYILLDRLLIFHGSVINWTHARREVSESFTKEISEHLRQGVTAQWDDESKKVCRQFFESLCSKGKERRKHGKIEIREQMEAVIMAALEKSA